MSGAGDTDGADGPVTVLVARRVVPGREVEFETWASELTRAASGFDGFLGAGLLRPGHVGELWHVVYRFASADELARWEHSQTRSELLAHGEQVMSTTHERRMTGLHFWATGYSVSTVGLDEGRVRQYIRDQENLASGQGELDLK